jgi:hypothetical protein
MTNFKLEKHEIPNTREGFVAKWQNDAIFRAKAQLAGYNVLFENVIFPDGRVADMRVK